MEVFYLGCSRVPSAWTSFSAVQLVHLLLSQLCNLSWISLFVTVFLFLAGFMLDDILVSHTGSSSRAFGIPCSLLCYF